MQSYAANNSHISPLHDFQQEADRERQELLELLGLRFLRIRAQLIETDL
jgi:very-short-patch-repair endonuclease